MYPERPLAARGYCVLPDMLPDSHFAALLAEATGLAEKARRAKGNYYCVNKDRSVSSPRCLSTVAGGPVLQAIHHGEQYLEILERTVGRFLSPTRSSYIYYAPGDYIGLHIDASVCEVTLITGILGPVAPVVLHPSLIGVSPEKLLAISLAHSAMPPAGIPVAVPSRGSFLMLLGSSVPHHRPAALASCTIATLCYA